MPVRGGKDKTCRLAATGTTAAGEQRLPENEEAASESAECWDAPVRCGEESDSSAGGGSTLLAHMGIPHRRHFPAISYNSMVRCANPL